MHSEGRRELPARCGELCSSTLLVGTHTSMATIWREEDLHG